MRLNYTITEELYAEVIEYQMRLHNSQKSQILKYWVSNILFCGLALYFLIARTEYSWWLRLMPAAMAVILLAMSTHKRVNLPKRARTALRRYIRSGTLEEGFIGPHTLLVENGMVRRGVGKDWAEIACDEAGPELMELKKSECLIARGAIYELIPKSVLEADNTRERLLNAIEEGRSEETRRDRTEAVQSELSKDAQMEIHWKVDEAAYVRGMVEGHRMYYRTRQAWRGSQTVRIIILLYGVVVLALRLNLYIGLAFLLIGLLLNRQLLVTFSPLSYQVVGKQISSVKGTASDLGEEVFYVTEKELKAFYMNQIQSTPIQDISNWKSNPAYTFLYTKSGQMYVIPEAAFEDGKEKRQFLKFLKLKPKK